jgi:integral membrane sensor domain MASE1
MINNNNEKTNQVRTEKRFSASVVICFASFIGAVLVISGSAAQAQTHNMTSANNMTSATAAVVSNALQEQEKIAHDTADAVANLARSQPEANNPFDPFSNGDNK